MLSLPSLSSRVAELVIELAGVEHALIYAFLKVRDV
jgi:hypothetical protein